MPELAKDTVALLYYLLPGFVVAWVFHALTSHQKPTQVERIIQALIFTLPVKALVIIEKILLIQLGKIYTLGAWDTDSEIVASLLSAIAFGTVASYFTNKDSFYTFLRRIGLSTRSADPSEWSGALSQYPRFLVLNLKDERRLYGWPERWPSDPEKGHFFITQPSWLDSNGNIELAEIEGLLIDVKDVSHVEFLKQPGSNP